jgi:hypothetical protein
MEVANVAAIRTVDQIARKWASVTPQRSADYEAGVQDPKSSWASATAAAVEAWKTGVQSAIQEGRFAKGVAKAGDAAWQAGAVEKGVQRWGPGVALAESKYQQGFAPYQAAIARTTLPPRYARRDPRNMARVTAIVDALRKVKSGA